MITSKSIKQKIRRRIQRKGYKKPAVGLDRQWVRCKECDWIGYYDYVPYGLDRPILTMGCNCGLFDDVSESVHI